MASGKCRWQWCGQVVDCTLTAPVPRLDTCCTQSWSTKLLICTGDFAARGAHNVATPSRSRSQSRPHRRRRCRCRALL